MRIAKAAAVASVGFLVGCGGGSRVQETASSVPRRDLTLTTTATEAPQIASKIELVSVRQTHRPRSTGAIAHVAAQSAPEAPPADPAPPSELPVVAAAPVEASVVETPASDATGRELAPGKTVTVIPASAGPASAEGGEVGWSEVPARRGGGVAIIGGGHGGSCRGGRGRGPVSILR